MSAKQKPRRVLFRWKFSFFDSLMVAAALAGSCGRLYSEDLQHWQSVRDLTIVNPFLPGFVLP